MVASLRTYTAFWPATWTLLFLAVFVWSAINPKDYPTWILEVAPAVIGFIILAVTRKFFPLTTLCYSLILLFCWILFVGGHYTYAEVPLFDTIKEVFNQSRNNFDKLGHFAQGFVPAIVCREIIIRLKIINGKFFTHFFTVCFCLALSAFYELLEWWTALLSEDAAEAFLGTQGYVWDTQSDMAWALLGAISALILLSNSHNKQIRQIQLQVQSQIS
jgi:putative membrane protein